MTEMDDAGLLSWNEQIIAEFRANEGRVGGQFEGAPLLLLHHVGAKSGAQRVTPMMYQDLDGNYAVFASKGGADTNPAWYHNLLAYPEVNVEVGTDTVPVTARETHDAERSTIWETQKQRYPGFAEYEAKTDRQIPVIVLERAAR